MKEKDIMIDLETLGTRAGCGILSIGAVAFDPYNMMDPRTSDLGPEFYVVINRLSCGEAGLFEEESTLTWWSQQSGSAREVLQLAEEGGLLLVDALDKLTEYLAQFELWKVRIWGNGSDFDNAILANCYAAVGQELPWKFWNNRCYRTLKSISKGPKLKREGTYHNALDDAKTQARHAVQLLR